MKLSLKATWFSLCLTSLVGCSSSGAGTNAGPQAAQAGRTVEAGPLLCLLQSDTAGPGLASVTCTVTIGNSQASTEGIDISVTNILDGIVLDGVCQSFSKAEVLEDSHEFNQAVQAELSAAYVRSGIGWTVESVSCKISEYSAP